MNASSLGVLFTNAANVSGATLALQGKEVRNPLPPSTGFDTERRTDVFKQPWAEEAAVSYLAKKTGGGALAPGAPAVLPGRALPLQQVGRQRCWAHRAAWHAKLYVARCGRGSGGRHRVA